ncbi:tRNA(adenine34) deaminase [Altererythrobacter xiamenensis]|uniref:tRNA(Adenine34) deaminase n=1 Tax=Altererythrobacter xiamenensis TaxID=1316679 RepID=A0A1Y6F3A8_9SPHN|nr:nucleoside deaminase [Altererythrobacter xiamenensis]SMQ69378.1 tRNA(adenine34) deaminase [Altererythrobacter xiamenensis]
MNETSDEHWMRLAMEHAIAEKGTDPANTPIGALIVLDGEEIARSVNHTARDCDPTAHAEIETIRNAGEKLQEMRLESATLYSTLQPCGMCTFASIWAGVSRIVYGAGRDDVHEMYFEDRHLSTLDYVSDAYKEDLELVGGVLAEECAQLYYRPGDDVPEDEQAND